MSALTPNPVDCTDCTVIVAVDPARDSDLDSVAAAVVYCPEHRRVSRETRAAALASNPDLAAIYERFGIDTGATS